MSRGDALAEFSLRQASVFEKSDVVFFTSPMSSSIEKSSVEKQEASMCTFVALDSNYQIEIPEVMRVSIL